MFILNPENKGKRITVYDIAQAAGVSPATVSRVLTGNANVSLEKKRKVEALLREYDFHPNAMAQGLLKSESKTIGLIMPDIINPFFSSMYTQLEKPALKHGYSILMGNSMSRAEIESALLQLFLQKQVDAFIFMGGRVNKMRIPPEDQSELFRVSQTAPIIMLNGNENLAWENCYNVVTDEFDGIVHLMEYLISLGHREIVLIGGTRTITSSVIKRDAFQAVMRRHNIPLRKDWFIHAEFSPQGGEDAMQLLLDGRKMPTAIIGVNDSVAIGLLKQAQIHHIRVPEDISIAGFDDTYLSSLTYPRLTTVSQNYEACGETVIDTVVKVKSGEKAERLKRVPTRLIIRESCGPPGKD